MVEQHCYSDTNVYRLFASSERAPLFDFQVPAFVEISICHVTNSLDFIMILTTLWVIRRRYPIAWTACCYRDVFILTQFFTLDITHESNKLSRLSWMSHCALQTLTIPIFLARCSLERCWTMHSTTRRLIFSTFSAFFFFALQTKNFFLNNSLYDRRWDLRDFTRFKDLTALVNDCNEL